MSSPRLEWISTGGGPLLLLQTDLLPQWEGAELSERQIAASSRWIPEGPATDYDRACDVGELGFVSVGSGQGLVMGDEPLPTAWWPLPREGGGLFVRWVYADDDAAVARALESVSTARFDATGLVFPVRQSDLVLFDSAMPGYDIRTAHQTVVMWPGWYTVESARMSPDPHTSVVLHRLRPAG
ncbi:MAG: Imm21 family immunity protein [Gemmatimonadaceae bacterium]